MWKQLWYVCSTKEVNQIIHFCTLWKKHNTCLGDVLTVQSNSKDTLYCDSDPNVGTNCCKALASPHTAWHLWSPMFFSPSKHRFFQLDLNYKNVKVANSQREIFTKNRTSVTAKNCNYFQLRSVILTSRNLGALRAPTSDLWRFTPHDLWPMTHDLWYTIQPNLG